MSKWKIDKRNEETDSSSVDIEAAIKKAKLLRVINIICYVCTAILFVFFVIGGLRSCKGKSHVADNTPHINRVVVVERDGYSTFSIDNSDINNEDFFNDLLDAVNDYGEILNEVEGNSTVIGELADDDWLFEIMSIDTVSNFGEHQVNGIQFYDENDETYIWYYYDNSPYISSSNEPLNIDNVHFDFLVSNDWLEQYYENVYVVLNDYVVTFDEGIFDAITDTVSNFTVTLGLGINAILVLFYSNNQLTVLGTITVIVVGVALVYFLIRFIFGLIRLRG